MWAQRVLFIIITPKTQVCVSSVFQTQRVKCWEHMHEFTHTCWCRIDALKKEKEEKSRCREEGAGHAAAESMYFLERAPLVSCNREHNTTRPQVRCFLHAALFFLLACWTRRIANSSKASVATCCVSWADLFQQLSLERASFYWLATVECMGSRQIVKDVGTRETAS